MNGNDLLTIILPDAALSIPSARSPAVDVLPVSTPVFGTRVTHPIGVRRVSRAGPGLESVLPIDAAVHVGISNGLQCLDWGGR